MQFKINLLFVWTGGRKANLDWWCIWQRAACRDLQGRPIKWLKEHSFSWARNDHWIQSMEFKSVKFGKVAVDLSNMDLLPGEAPCRSPVIKSVHFFFFHLHLLQWVVAGFLAQQAACGMYSFERYYSARNIVQTLQEITKWPFLSLVSLPRIEGPNVIFQGENQTIYPGLLHCYKCFWSWFVLFSLPVQSGIKWII